MKQTAVDWLVDQIENFNCMKIGLIPSDIIEEAKEMEKEQIKQAYLESSRETCLSYGEEPPHDDPKYAELYYKQTYGE